MTADSHSLPDHRTSQQLAHFEIRLVAVDKPTTRRRWNGGPLPSDEADEALREAVEAFQEALRVRGFSIVTTGYGVYATESAREPLNGGETDA